MIVCGKLAFLLPNLSRSSWFDLLMPLVSQILPIYIVIHYLTILQLISSRYGRRAITEQQAAQAVGGNGGLFLWLVDVGDGRWGDMDSKWIDDYNL
jgi:hypothetical protein